MIGVIVAYSVTIQPYLNLIVNRTEAITGIQQDLLNTTTNASVIYAIQTQSYANYSE